MTGNMRTENNNRILNRKGVTRYKDLIHRGRFAFVCMVFLLTAVMCSCSGSGLQQDGGYGTSADENLTVHFLDVGQADATLLVSEGEAVLVDAGNRDDAGYIVGYMEELGITELKYVIFTHPHEDHIGSGEAVIENFSVEKIFMGGEYDEGIEGALSGTIDRYGVETEEPQPGDSAVFGECRIDFLGPYHDFDDTNNDSICLKVTHGENSIMFTGDAGSTPEREMIDEGEYLEADILQAGHHGSSTSNSYYFLREVNPRYVVISCGSGNMYGHPHEEALSRFNDLGAEVFRTYLQGTVIAVDDGRTITFNCEGKKADRPYTEDPEEAAYIGNVNSRKYHLPDCSGLPYEENRVYFKTAEAAEKAGYKPCGRCMP